MGRGCGRPKLCGVLLRYKTEIGIKNNKKGLGSLHYAQAWALNDIIVDPTSKKQSRDCWWL